MQPPTQAEYIKRRQTLNDAFESGILVCFQFDNARMRRFQEHRHLKPLPTSDEEFFTQELAWKEIEIDIAVAKKEAFKRAYSHHDFPQVPTQQWTTNQPLKLRQSEIDKVRPEFADVAVLQPDITIQVLYDPKVYNLKETVHEGRQWQTVDFKWLSDGVQNEAFARLEKFFKAQQPASIPYQQEVYLRNALKPHRLVEYWDHAVMLLHHWLKAWIFIYQRSQDFKNLWEVTKILSDFKDREPFQDWHWKCMERYWDEGMGGQASAEP
ncbi:hypothetical protein G7Y79_00016g040660 [Physcia stellaris]|nr:hypothetical protein G7Y79_00016g040660 [Physcia stellaris]